ncbi:HAD family hydrolase [Roseivivax isoporae]|uniref:CbbY/CbbZ/GpH/YieH n=1 Tax=Roseivivax isoporae LMG 25204 TaxID=1449351 RepID=X7F8J9_9RHOB|nr:HAD-IA family hydrolase [Roseivivax isoporae]ETX29120.1 CbbY/CbbZ/GpH/YieH [Roseivivax isoporae LMG 25204]
MTLALLFDLDGTLLDSDPLHERVFRDLYAERGREIDAAYYLANIHGRHNPDIFSRDFPDADPHALSEEKEARFRERLPARVTPTAGLGALLDRAGDAGWPTALVTNAPRRNAETMLDAIGVRDRFPVVVIGDECTRAKPHPDPYLAALAALGTPPGRAIAFEDSPSGLRAARAAGVHVMGLRSSLGHEALLEAGAHDSIADFTDPALDRLLAALRADRPAR